MYSQSTSKSTQPGERPVTARSGEVLSTRQQWKKKEKLKSKNMGMLRSISKQLGESMESVLKKKRKATVGMICGKGRF